MYSNKVLFAVIVLFLVTLKTHRSYMGQGDEPHYVVIAESVWLDKDFDLSNNYVSPWLKQFDPDDYHAVRRPDGRLIATHSIGMSIVAAPIYGVVHFLLSETPLSKKIVSRDRRWVSFKNTFSFMMMLLAGALGIVLFRLFIELTEDVRVAWFSAFTIMLAPPLLSYGFLFFTELPSAFLISVTALRLAQAKPFGMVDAGCLGFLPFLHPRNYAVAGLLFVIRAWGGSPGVTSLRRFRSPSALMAAVCMAGLWGALLWISHDFWGTLNPAAPYGAIGQKAFDPECLLTTLPGYFLDRSFGLVTFAPLYALAPAGFFLLWRQNRFVTLVLLVVAGAYVVGVSGFRWGWGGWSPGPRYIVPVVPLMAVGPAVFAAAALRKPGPARIAARAMFVLSMFLAVLYWSKPKLLWNQLDGKSLFLLEWFAGPGQWIHDLLPNFFDPFPAPHGRALVIALIIGMINVWLARLLTTARPADKVRPADSSSVAI
jgi:hypothetical protein